MKVEGAELFRLALALLVLPVFLSFSRRLRDADWVRPMVAAYAVITLSYVLSIAEVFLAPRLLNMFQHLAYFVAGLLWIRVVLGMRRTGHLGGGSR